MTINSLVEYLSILSLYVRRSLSFSRINESAEASSLKFEAYELIPKSIISKTTSTLLGFLRIKCKYKCEIFLIMALFFI